MTPDRPEAGSSTQSPAATPDSESRIGLVRGTRDWLPAEYARLARLERRLLDQFARAGYRPMRTPILEFAELHERKSGAGIVAKLFGVPAAGNAEICLRPELTASIVRAYSEAEDCPPLPLRVSSSGPVFRYQAPDPTHDREFTQVGVELIGAGGPAADAELIWLADWSLRTILGPEDGARVTIRLGHVGLILELLNRSGLPAAAVSALVDSLSEAASEGENIHAIETALDRLAGWLGGTAADGPAPDISFDANAPLVGPGENPGIERLFRQLVPDVTGRRSGREIIGRLRRKWGLGHSLQDFLRRIRDQVHALADLRGPAHEILPRLEREYADRAPESVSALRELVTMLGHHGIEPRRIGLDLGFGRGIGFYTQMIFELIVQTPKSTIEVCGGGRYDGLARVLGGDKDIRGAGFAFGLERLLGIMGPARPALAASRGFLIAGTNRGGITPGAIRLATHLRDQVDIPVVLTELGLDAAAGLAGSAGLSHYVAVEPRLEAWDLTTGEVQAVDPVDLIDLGRGRLGVLGSDEAAQ